MYNLSVQQSGLERARFTITDYDAQFVEDSLITACSGVNFLNINVLTAQATYYVYQDGERLQGIDIAISPPDLSSFRTTTAGSSTTSIYNYNLWWGNAGANDSPIIDIGTTATATLYRYSQTGAVALATASYSPSIRVLNPVRGAGLFAIIKGVG